MLLGDLNYRKDDRGLDQLGEKIANGFSQRVGGTDRPLFPDAEKPRVIDLTARIMNTCKRVKASAIHDDFGGCIGKYVAVPERDFDVQRSPDVSVPPAASGVVAKVGGGGRGEAKCFETKAGEGNRDDRKLRHPSVCDRVLLVQVQLGPKESGATMVAEPTEDARAFIYGSMIKSDHSGVMSFFRVAIPEPPP